MPESWVAHLGELHAVLPSEISEDGAAEIYFYSHGAQHEYPAWVSLYGPTHQVEFGAHVDSQERTRMGERLGELGFERSDCARRGGASSALTRASVAEGPSQSDPPTQPSCFDHAGGRRVVMIEGPRTRFIVTLGPSRAAEGSELPSLVDVLTEYHQEPFAELLRNVRGYVAAIVVNPSAARVRIGVHLTDLGPDRARRLHRAFARLGFGPGDGVTTTGRYEGEGVTATHRLARGSLSLELQIERR